MFEDVAPETFVFQVGGELWARKRKACAHAFYKDRLEKMMEVLKEKLNTMVDKWNAQIDATPKKQTVIDLSVVFEELYCSFLI